MQLTFEGKTKYVRTDLEMQFPEPLDLPLEPWRIPTNIIHGPLCSFTALRGVAPWLNRLSQVRALNAGSLPDQGFIWAMAQIPFKDVCGSAGSKWDELSKKIEPEIVSMVKLEPHLTPSRRQGRMDDE